MLVDTVCLIPSVLARRAVVANRVFPVQIVSVNTVRQIPIVLAMKVVVTVNVKPAPIAGFILVPSTLIAEMGSPVVTEYAQLYAPIV